MAKTKDESILGKEIKGSELLVLTDAGVQVMQILSHAGKWDACQAPVAVARGFIPRRSDLIVLRVRGFDEPQVWHRSFWQILDPGL